MSYTISTVQIDGRKVINIDCEGELVASAERARADEPDSMILDLDAQWASEVNMNEVIQQVRALL